LCCDGQRQRQPGAQPDQIGGSLRFRVHPFRSQPQDQQLARLVLGQQVQGQRVRAFGGDQTGQLTAAGDHRHAAGAARQQRADLLGFPRVV
jgi:hypothetical protein